MASLLDAADRIGFLDPAAESRPLGGLAIEQMLEACGFEAIRAGREICEAAVKASSATAARSLGDWMKGEGVTVVVYGCREEPEFALRLLSYFLVALKSTCSLATEGGRVRTLFFAGLPETCDLVRERFPAVSGVFRGDEGPAEIIEILGLPRSLLPDQAARDVAYDEARTAFGRELVGKGEYLSVGPVDRKGSRRFGQRGDGIAARIAHGAARGLPPIVCATVGPSSPTGGRPSISSGPGPPAWRARGSSTCWTYGPRGSAARSLAGAGRGWRTAEAFRSGLRRSSPKYGARPVPCS